MSHTLDEKLVKRQRPKRGIKASPFKTWRVPTREHNGGQAHRALDLQKSEHLQLWVDDVTTKPPLRKGRLAFLPASS